MSRFRIDPPLPIGYPDDTFAVIDNAGDLEPIDSLTYAQAQDVADALNTLAEEGEP